MSARGAVSKGGALLLLLNVALFGCLWTTADADAAPVPGWKVLGVTAPTNLPPQRGSTPGEGRFIVYVTNVGGVASTGTVTVTIGSLPNGITLNGSATGGGWSCLPSGEKVICTRTIPVPSGATTPTIIVPLSVSSVAAEHSQLPLSVVGGGGTEEAIYTAPVKVSPEPAAPGVQAMWAGAFDAEGKPATQAGGHPNLAGVGFLLNTVETPSGNVIPSADLKDLGVELPPGFIGNPMATEERCPQFNPAPLRHEVPCQENAAVGFSQVSQESVTGGASFSSNQNTGNVIYNDAPPLGFPAEFTFNFVEYYARILGSLRSSSDFGVTVTAPEIPLFYWFYGAFTMLEGTPADAGGRAFISNPGDCAEQARLQPVTTIVDNSWQLPSNFDHKSVSIPPVTNCRPLTEAWRGEGSEPERPSFEFQPASSEAAAGTAVTAKLHIPQEGLTDPDKLATSDLKKTNVTLPQGLNLNPSAANGLEACTEAQVGYVKPGEPGGEPLPDNPTRFNEDAPACPDGSKLGNFQVKSPLLEEELEGTIYLAAQEENPFHSLLALYLVVDDAKTGIVLKLPGEVKPDASTGQLTAIFDNNPQLPFEDLTLHFRGGGPRSQLATPEVCGTYKTIGSLTPWSAESESPSEAAQIEEPGFRISSGPGGGPCASSAATRPFLPSFEAGTTSTQAGSYSPLVIKIGRKDGEQELTSLEFTLPKGLTGRLAGIPYCSDAAIGAAEAKTGKAELANPSCPAASQLGTVDTSAGYGPEPIHVGGKVYLAGPYKGAPISTVVITPAVAGPFDLGTVVVRSPTFVNPETAQITAKTDPIPTILKGIPLKLRSVTVNVDRAAFTLNPTNCEAMALTATISSSDGATVKPSNRFQVGGCSSLGFKPNLKIQLKGQTKRTGHPGLKAVVTYPQGSYANIARAQVNLPHGEFLDQGNLNKTCTKPVLLAGNCPASSIYGKAVAWTPLLEKSLKGNVYLVGGYGYKLPALVAELNGQIRVLLVGKVDSGPNKGIRNTFEVVPDAPVEKFELQMKGGKKYGLLENSENLCKASKEKRQAIARFTAQNGIVQQTKPVVANQCKKGKKK